jgi:flagellar biosynthesis protein FlhB
MKGIEHIKTNFGKPKSILMCFMFFMVTAFVLTQQKPPVFRAASNSARSTLPSATRIAIRFAA